MLSSCERWSHVLPQILGRHKKVKHNTPPQYSSDIYPNNAPFPLRVRLSGQNVPTRIRQTDGSDFLNVNMTLPDKSLSFLAVCVLVIILDRRNYRLLQRRVCGCSTQSRTALKGLQLLKSPSIIPAATQSRPVTDTSTRNELLVPTLTDYDWSIFVQLFLCKFSLLFFQRQVCVHKNNY